MQSQNRYECGWLGIDKQTCLKRGCCWDESDPNAKYCYVKGNSRKLWLGHSAAKRGPVKKFGDSVYATQNPAFSQVFETRHKLTLKVMSSDLNISLRKENWLDDFVTRSKYFPVKSPFFHFETIEDKFALMATQRCSTFVTVPYNRYRIQCNATWYNKLNTNNMYIYKTVFQK